MKLKLNKIIRNLIGISFVGTAMAFGFWPESSPEQAPVNTETVVQVAPVTAESTRRQLRFSGITRSARHAVLSFTVPARMAVRSVEIGDRVAAGDVLAMLDVREFDIAVASSKARVVELKARLDQAKRDWRRLDRLSGSGAAATKDTERAATTVEALRAALQAAESRLAEARRVRSEAELKAPFSGTITAVRLEPGEWADPGRPVVSLSGDREFELEVDVPETFLGRLSVGDTVTVVLPLLGGKQMQGRVASMATAALSSGRLFPLVVSLEPTEVLTAGLTAELILSIRTPTQLMVPVNAVINPGSSRPSLFVVESGRARRAIVELGTFSGDRVSVSGDLSAGDWVVVNGHTSLSDGKPVEVRS